MNLGNEDNNYFGGIPSSIISYTPSRGRYAAYDGVYDIQSTTSQQLTTLQTQISAIQSRLTELEDIRIVQTLSDNPNFIANGDCSQFSMPSPMYGDAAGGTEIALQGRGIPIMDRWYHVCELSGFNPTNFRMKCKQVKVSDYVTGYPPYGTVPVISPYALSISYYNRSSPPNPIFSKLEHLGTRNTDKYGGMMAIQHRIPDVTSFNNVNLSLGFWIKSNTNTQCFVAVYLQYNYTNGGGNGLTGNGLTRILIENFSVSTEWTYITKDIVIGSLPGGKTIVDGQNGLVIQIGPVYYVWDSTHYVIYGSATPFLSNRDNTEFVITEIQLRSDGKCNALNFPYNIRESDRTLPYINYCSTTIPSQISNTSTYEILSVGAAYAAGVLSSPIRTTYACLIPLRFSSRMIKVPSYAFFVYKKTDTGDTSVQAYFEGTTQISTAAAGPMLFKNDSMTGLGVDVFGSSGDGTSEFVNSNIEPSGPLLVSTSQTQAVFKFQLTGTGYLTPTASVMKTAWNSNKWGWWVFVVPEVASSGSAKDWIYSVDYSWSSPTTRPFF